jgi:hypothetical protein
MKSGRFFLYCFTAFSFHSQMAHGAQTITRWEKESKDEEAQAQRMVDDALGQVQHQYMDNGQRPFRQAHPRAIGCVATKFTVDKNLPAKYQAGVFATPGQSFDGLIRFSNSLGPITDAKGDARGLAIKLMGVPGKKLGVREPDALTQDFVFINAPTFPARDSVEFGSIVHLKTDPKSIVGFLLGNPILRAKELADTNRFGSAQYGLSLAEMKWFSQTPYLFKGPQLETPVKYMLRPCGPVKKIAMDKSESELRNDMQSRLSSGDVCFEFGVQIYKEGQLIEDGRNEWTEQDSPFVRLASVNIPAQQFVTDEKLAYCDVLSWQTWHSLEAHRPLGNINRSRRIVYEAMSKARAKHTGQLAQQSEPKDLSMWNSFTSTKYDSWKGLTVPEK